MSSDIKRTFDLGTQEMEYSDQLRCDVFNVVGFVFCDKKTLVIFPKHYMEQEELDLLNTTNEESIEDIKLLYGVIKKYCDKENTSATARRYIGPYDEDMYESDYPFAPFYDVYEYYQKYGLYREKETNIKANSLGKISWKHTMQKSQKIMGENNLIFAPLYVNKKNYRHVFLTECMAFVIDYTIERFSDFVVLKQTGMKKSKFDYLNNVDYVLQQLNKAKNEVFKDVNKKLVQSLIEFFVQYREKAYGGKIHIKIRHFNIIWQKMLGYYLNRHFIGMSTNGEQTLFDGNITESTIRFEDVIYNDIDDSPHGFSIDIDHVAITNNELYIFDSKYYANANDFNYKQFAYNELLRYYINDIVAINNVLLLPGRSGSGIHFSMSPKYQGPRTIGNKIIEQYLEPRDVMRDYVSF